MYRWPVGVPVLLLRRALLPAVSGELINSGTDEAEAAAKRKREGKPVLGVAAILAQDPHDHPGHPKKEPPPFVHAAIEAARFMIPPGWTTASIHFRRQGMTRAGPLSI